MLEGLVRGVPKLTRRNQILASVPSAAVMHPGNSTMAARPQLMLAEPSQTETELPL
jgi:hypothetical protein